MTAKPWTTTEEAHLRKWAGIALVTQIAAFVHKPERFLNLHWLNPAYVIPVVELSCHTGTSAAVLARTKSLREQIGKLPVVCGARPGDIGPRQQALVRNEAARKREEGGGAEAVVVPSGPIVMVGLGMVVFYMVDTASQTWGPTYLDDAFSTPESLVALATFPYLLASLVVRLAGDGLVARYGAVRVLRTGSVVASIALLVVVSAPTWPVAVLGFTLLGAGVSVVAPLSFSAAARIAGGQGADRASVDAVIGRFNQFNYVGALLGSVLTGLVGADSLRVGFALPMVLVLALIPLARSFAPSPEVTDRSVTSGG